MISVAIRAAASGRPHPPRSTEDEQKHCRERERQTGRQTLPVPCCVLSCNQGGAYPALPLTSPGAESSFTGLARNDVHMVLNDDNGYLQLGRAALTRWAKVNPSSCGLGRHHHHTHVCHVDCCRTPLGHALRVHSPKSHARHTFK